MDENEKCIVIKYQIFIFKRFNSESDYSDMKNVLGDDAPSAATIYRWVAKLQQGIDNLQKMTTVQDIPLTRVLMMMLNLSSTIYREIDH